MKEYKHYFKKHNKFLNRKESETDEEYKARIWAWERHEIKKAVYGAEGIEIIQNQIAYLLNGKEPDEENTGGEYKRGFQEGLACARELMIKECGFWLDSLRSVAEDPLEYEIQLVGDRYKLGKRG